MCEAITLTFWLIFWSAAAPPDYALEKTFLQIISRLRSDGYILRIVKAFIKRISDDDDDNVNILYYNNK